MTQDNTIQVSIDSETENYAVYESADGDTIVGMYVAEEAAEQVGEFAEVEIGAEGGLTASKKKDTSNYGVFKNEPAISGMYVSHDELDGEESDEGEPVAPDELNIQLNASSEQAFEEAIGNVEEQADALVGDADDSDEEESEPSADEQAEALVGDADDSDDSDTSDESEDVEISDEEIGLE